MAKKPGKKKPEITNPPAVVDVFEGTEVHPWHQQPKEPDNAFAQFSVYLNLGPKRSLRQAYIAFCQVIKETPKANTPIEFKRIAIQYKWEERVGAFQKRMVEQAIALQDFRRAELVDMEYDVGKQLLERAMAMLKFPLQRVVKKDDETGQTIIIEPMDWTAADIPRLAEMASRLARVSLDMRQAGMEINVNNRTSNAAATTPVGEIHWLKEIMAREQLQLPGPSAPPNSNGNGHANGNGSNGHAG